MDKVFSLFGVQEELKTDNGPSFQSHEFRNFSNKLGFKDRRSTPCWPKANGEAERFMRNLGKAIRKLQVEGKKQLETGDVFTFLRIRNFRATPHSTTG